MGTNPRRNNYGTQYFRRSKSSDAYEDRSQPHHVGRDRHVGFFGIQEKLNTHATKLQIMEKDLEMNSEFRIKWPRGLLGSLPRGFRAIYAHRGTLQTER